MQSWNDLADVPRDLGHCVVAIGVFDGVHLGHQAIVARAVAEAQAAGARTVVVTFEPHPAQVLRPDMAPLRLTTPEAKAALLAELDIDGLLVMPFTRALSDLEPVQFVGAVLHDRLHVGRVVIGANFRFGRRAEGDVHTLAALGPAYGFQVDAVPLVTVAGRTVSSTEVRGLVADGEVEDAAVLLGRPYRLDGPVVHGDARGRQLGYPTANLGLTPGVAVPADGVYAGWLVRTDAGGGELRLPAAVSVGTNPTFDGTGRRVEAFVIGREDAAAPGDPGWLDLYDEQVGIEFAHRLRGMVKFDSVEALVEQMGQDVAEATGLLVTDDQP